MGTIINVIGIIIGGLLGLFFGGKLKDKYQTSLISVCGLSSMFIGISGTLSSMFTVSNGKINSNGTMMAIICLTLGCVIGELLGIEDKLEALGEWLKIKTKSEKDNSFVNAFVTASLTVCIGAMAIVGSIQDGIWGDSSTLVAKAILDLIIVMVFAASLGKGAIFSALPVLVLQGSVTLLAKFIEPLMTEAALTNLSITGNMLIFCVGINLIWPGKFKVANMLPGIILAVIWSFLPINI